MTHNFSTSEPIGDERTNQLLSELENSNQLAIRQTRESSSRSVNAAVDVRAGDVCARANSLATGTARELQQHGLSCVLAEPVITGSVFYLVFDREALDLAPELAICDRSIMLSDTAFDTHFRFVRDIDFPGDELPR